MRVASTGSVASTPRYLGGAFVFQFATSLAAGLLTASILSGSISEVLSDVADHPGQLRAGIVLELLTSIGIIAMTALLYVVLGERNRPVALVALGLWMAEAVVLAVKALALYLLLAVDQSERSLGALALGLSQHAGDVAMLFFCVGAFGWYYLLLESQIVPRTLALWGLLAVPLVLVATLMLLWDRGSDPTKGLYAPYVPYELVLGLWLLVKGARVPTHSDSPPVAGERARLVGR